MFTFSLQKRLVAAALIGQFAIAGLASAQPAPFTQKPFTDVRTNHANYTAIEYLRTNNILRGYPDGTFRPDNSITRAEFVRLIVNPFIMDTERLSNCVASETNENSDNVFFTDVQKDDWFANEVCLAHVTDLIDGYADNTFKPNHYINFAEAAKIISNVFAFNRSTEDQPTTEWFKPYVEKLAELKAIPTTITRMDKEITRGEMVEMVYRVKADNTKKASMTYAGIKRY